MDNRRIIWIVVISLLLTSSTLFIKIIPCISWYGSNTGLEDFSPHDEFCKVNFGKIGPLNEYFYQTTSPITTLVITFVVSLMVVFCISLILKKIKVIKSK